jgi:hypothetical protein
MTLETIESPFTADEQRAASRLNEEISGLLSSISGLEKSLMQNWARLSGHLFQVRERKFWILYGYESFGKYIVDIGDKVGKGRSQLYQGIRVVEQLPEVSAEELTEIGISKSTELCKMRAAGKSVPRELIDRAKNPSTTISDVREDVFNALNTNPDARGKYWDLSGFFCTPEEKGLLEHAIELAKRTDPAVAHDIPEWAQRKEVFIRFAMEYISTYEDGR